MLRLDPDFLRQGAPLVAEGTPLAFHDERGTGLGSLLDAVFARNVRDYLALEESLKSLFPSVAGFRLYTDAGQRRIGIRLINGTDVPAEYLSEGMLYFLAFAILPYLSPVSVILVEEPENGLHPSRIAEVMRVLRKISETTQVVLATHSPLVVNELQPEEVTLVTRTPEEGTKFTPLTETPNFEKRASAYALGELWLNYADGISEAALFKPTGS
jgi:predicted ATPase